MILYNSIIYYNNTLKFKHITIKYTGTDFERDGVWIPTEWLLTNSHTKSEHDIHITGYQPIQYSFKILLTIT